MRSRCSRCKAEVASELDEGRCDGDAPRQRHDPSHQEKQTGGPKVLGRQSASLMTGVVRWVGRRRRSGPHQVRRRPQLYHRLHRDRIGLLCILAAQRSTINAVLTWRRGRRSRGGRRGGVRFGPLLSIAAIVLLVWRAGKPSSWPSDRALSMRPVADGACQAAVTLRFSRLVGRTLTTAATSGVRGSEIAPRRAAAHLGRASGTGQAFAPGARGGTAAGRAVGSRRASFGPRGSEAMLGSDRAVLPEDQVRRDLDQSRSPWPANGCGGKDAVKTSRGVRPSGS